MKQKMLTNRLFLFSPHSGDVQEGAVRTNASYEKQQNLEFTSAESTYMRDVTSVYDATRLSQDSSDASLSNFFSRPIKIFETGWGTGTALYSNFDPWSLYFNNPRVVNRISNYKLLRCKLHVKIVLNGNGFFYGRAIAAYMPLFNLNTLNTNRALIPADLVQVSQLPHIFLNPTLSTGGEMLLPFFYYYNNLNVPSSNWVNMGNLTIRSLNNLKHANAATDNVTISVFAWADDVVLSGLTSVEPFTLAPQSGEMEQATKGVISRPATAMAKAMGVLSKIPYIAPMALSTQMALNATSDIAKCFGYSRPVNISEPQLVVIRPAANIATTDTPDLSCKLTVDSKQELSIDPMLSGLDENIDPLAIRTISMKESYLTKFVWSTTSPGETLLWNTAVSPVLWAENVAGTITEYHLPAMAVAALPFQYWTGSIRFRFQIVASAFHKGRIKVAFDPNFFISNEYNVNYVHIFDLAESNDFTISVANMQDRTLLQHAKPGINALNTLYSSTLLNSVPDGNGRLAVFVVNELTTPNSSVNNDVEVNVFVSTGDDFEVFVPDDHIQRFVFKPQSGVVPEKLGGEQLDRPTHDSVIYLGATPYCDTRTNLVFAGEAISSFRELLHRYSIHHTIGGTLNGAAVAHEISSVFPYFRGNVPGAVNTTSAAVPYNYCNTLLIHWIVSCYAGWRGSIRWKANFRGGGVYSNRLRTMVTRATRPVSYERAGVLLTAATSSSNAALACMTGVGTSALPVGKYPTGMNGAAFVSDLSANVLEWESPFYHDARFFGGKTANYTTAVNTEGYVFSMVGTLTPAAAYDMYTAIGEDFQVYFWTGLPPVFYEPNPPNA